VQHIRTFEGGIPCARGSALSLVQALALDAEEVADDDHQRRIAVVQGQSLREERVVDVPRNPLLEVAGHPDAQGRGYVYSRRARLQAAHAFPATAVKKVLPRIKHF